jgi:hypothetical protein
VGQRPQALRRRSRNSATYALLHGGVPVIDSMSKATSTASIPSDWSSAATSLSSLATHGRFQYVASAST